MKWIALYNVSFGRLHDKPMVEVGIVGGKYGAIAFRVLDCSTNNFESISDCIVLRYGVSIWIGQVNSGYF